MDRAGLACRPGALGADCLDDLAGREMGGDVMDVLPKTDWGQHIAIYQHDGRPLTPTAIGYEAAAFWRYRGRFGADVDSAIEFHPSWQWGLL